MLRLWNLLDGRCIYKRRLGVNEETQKITAKEVGVKWEPTLGKLYAILFEKKLEVFNAEASGPLSSVSSDVTFNCFDFVSSTEIMTADIQGRFTFVKNIQEEEKTTITLINTKINRFRDIRCYPGTQTLVTAPTEGKLCFYDVQVLREFHFEIGNAKPAKTVKSKSRFLCISINHMRPEVKQKKVKKQNKTIVKKKKLSKDERLLLKR
jgi:hypothetical protein